MVHTCTEGGREWYIHVLRERVVHTCTQGERVVHTCTEGGGGREWYIHILRERESGTYMY